VLFARTLTLFIMVTFGQISLSRGGKYVAGCLLECLIALKIKVARTSETSLNFYQTTQHNIPGDSHLQEFCFAIGYFIALLVLDFCMHLLLLLLLVRN
jgi:hypothetical protein